MPPCGLVVGLGVQDFGPVEAERAERENEAESRAEAMPEIPQPKLAGGDEDIARVPIDAPVEQLVDRKTQLLVQNGDGLAADVDPLLRFRDRDGRLL